MDEFSRETIKKIAMDTFLLTSDEYDIIPDKFGLFVCCQNKKYDDYHGKITRDNLVKYGILDRLSEQPIDKDKVCFWWRSILHIEYLKTDDNLF